MRQYELVMVLRPSVTEKDREKLLSDVKALLKDVKIAKEEDWGQKPLAYPIKHEAAGVYMKWDLETELTIPAGFEQTLIQNDKILRHLVVRTK
jgi:small subunit ribosomal protein S6